ncbi:hypothetical protein Tco_0696952 [Tanacetum coccineum]
MTGSKEAVRPRPKETTVTGGLSEKESQTEASTAEDQRRRRLSNTRTEDSQAYGHWDAITEEEVDEKKNYTTKGIIFQTLPENVLLQVAKYKSAKDVWESIKVRYIGAERVQKASLQTLRNELEMLKMNDNESINDFAGKISGIVAKFKSLGSSLEEEVIVRKFLNSVTKNLEAKDEDQAQLMMASEQKHKEIVDAEEDVEGTQREVEGAEEEEEVVKEAQTEKTETEKVQTETEGGNQERDRDRVLPEKESKTEDGRPKTAHRKDRRPKEKDIESKDRRFTERPSKVLSQREKNERVARSFGFAARADVIIGLCLSKGESEPFFYFGLTGSVRKREGRGVNPEKVVVPVLYGIQRLAVANRSRVGTLDERHPPFIVGTGIEHTEAINRGLKAVDAT